MHRQTHKNKPAKKFGSFDSFKFDGCERKNNAVNHQKTAYGKGFGVPEVIRTPDLSLRRRSLYPAELRKRMQQIFNFEPSQDSNDLPLRRRSLYPAELRKRMAAEPPILFCEFALALCEETVTVHNEALMRALADQPRLIRSLDVEDQAAPIDLSQRCRAGDAHADRGR